MNLNRFMRIMRARWWALVIVALVSIWVASQMTNFRNGMEPEFEALADITFLQQLGEVDESGALLRLENAESLALEVNAVQLAERLHPLAPWETSAILRDDRTKQLKFIGRGSTASEAIETAETLRAAFLAQEPFTGVLNIESQLKTLSARITQLRTFIAEAVEVPPEPLPLEPDLVAEANLQALQAQIEALRASYNSLSVELLDPILRTTAVIEAERNAVLQALVALQLQLQSLCVDNDSRVCQPLALTPEQATTDPSFGFSVENLEQDLELRFWQIEANQLEEAYRELFLRKVELDTIATVDETVLRDSTLIPVNPVANQALALVAGLLVGVLGLMVADRIRKPIWSAVEVDSRATLPEIAPRGWATPSGPWYTTTGPGERKSGIQALRAFVEGLNADNGVAVGIVGLAVHPEDIQELAADLASSVAVSGHRALLIDANFEHPADLIEFPSNATNLSAILRTAANDSEAELRDRLQRVFEVDNQTASGFHALPAGGPSHDAPDLLSKRGFGVLLAVAKTSFDVVIVSGADLASPITQVLSQRLDSLLFLGSAGHTLESTFAATKREFMDRRAQVAGMALLTRRPTRLRRRIRAGARQRARALTPQPSRQPQPPIIDREPATSRHGEDSDPVGRRGDSQRERDAG